MGVGDDIMATGLARGAHARGKKIAFGDGRRIIWGPFSEMAFRNNPNIARSLAEPNIEWVRYHKGNRIYNRLGNGRWIWNYAFKAQLGEFFFDDTEKTHAVRRPGFILIEPNVPWHKSVAPNKDWGLEKYQAVADALRGYGFQVCQNSYGTRRLKNVDIILTPDFRCAVASLSGFDLVITPEGGIHHAAAAVGANAIVLFGGFIPPEVTGYRMHVNLTGGAEACGSLNECKHCRDAMRNISVEEVLDHVLQLQSAQARNVG